MHGCMDVCFVYSNEHTVYLCVDAVRVFLRSIVRTEYSRQPSGWRDGIDPFDVVHPCKVHLAQNIS